MAASGIIDTGAILALVDRNDLWHSRCKEAYRQQRLPLLTSSAVLTELFHLLRNSRIDMEIIWAFIESGAVLLGAITHSELPHVHRLMSQYADRPMDFADATLVYLARRESLTTILTVDHSDFEIYRIEGRKKFQVLPNPRG